MNNKHNNLIRVTSLIYVIVGLFLSFPKANATILQDGRYTVTSTASYFDWNTVFSGGTGNLQYPYPAFLPSQNISAQNPLYFTTIVSTTFENTTEIGVCHGSGCGTYDYINPTAYSNTTFTNGAPYGGKYMSILMDYATANWSTTDYIQPTLELYGNDDTQYKMVSTAAYTSIGGGNYKLSVNPWYCISTTIADCATPPVIPPQITFTFPNFANTPDFTNWVVDISTTIPETYNGTVTVNYGQNSTSLQFADSAQWNTFISTNPFPIRKTVLLNPIINLNQTTTWYAQASYQYGTTTITTDKISFNINPNNILPVTTSTILGQPFGSLPFTNPSSTASSSLPYADCGITNISGCLTNVGIFLGNFFFRPTTNIANGMTASINETKQQFPFSVVFNLASTSQTAFTNASTAAPTELTLTLPAPFGISVPILTSTTLETAVGSTTKNMIFNTEINLIWLGAGIRILFFII